MRLGRKKITVYSLQKTRLHHWLEVCVWRILFFCFTCVPNCAEWLTSQPRFENTRSSQPLFFVSARLIAHLRYMSAGSVQNGCKAVITAFPFIADIFNRFVFTVTQNMST